MSSIKNTYTETNKDFKYWRKRTLFSIMLGYGAYYFVRQNFSCAVPSICKDLCIDKAEVGWAMSVGAVCYGFGKFLFGLIGDKFSARYVLSIGLALSGLINIFLGCSSSIYLIVVFVALNQCAQAMGNPPCAKMLANWYRKNEIGSKWGLWNMAAHVGGAVSVWLSSQLVACYNWRQVFYIPGALAIIVSLLVFSMLRDTPKSLGFKSIDELECATSQTLQNEKPKISEIVKLILTNKPLWLVSFAGLFVYINKMVFFNWGPTLLQEARGSSVLGSGCLMSLFDIAGVFGGLLIGSFSDKHFKNKRSAVPCLCMLVTGIVMSIFQHITGNSIFLMGLCIVLLGACMTGPMVLIGVMATEVASKKASGSAAGFTGTLGYLGTALAGVGTGSLATSYGWNAVITVTIVTAFCAALLFGILWFIQAKKK